MKILLDYSSYAWRALLAGKDKINGYYDTEGEGEPVYVNSSQYGVDIFCKMLATKMKDFDLNPCDLIVIQDGVNGKQLRRNWMPEYSGGRDKSAMQCREYAGMEAVVLANLRNLGSQIVEHRGVEADDLITYMCDVFKDESVLVLSFDGDMLALTAKSNVNVLLGDELNPKKYGDFDYQYLDVYKALVGDTSDKIPGARGFGQAAFDKVFAKFGNNGLAVIRKLIQTNSLNMLKDDAKTLTELQRVIDNATNVGLSWKCARLYPDYCNWDKLEWTHGMNTAMGEVTAANLEAWSKTDLPEGIHPEFDEWKQVTIPVTAANFSEARAQILDFAKQNALISLDVETTTPEESDEWIFSLKNEENDKILDVMGSELTSIQLTVGKNFHRTFVIPLRQAETDNVSLALADELLRTLDKDCRWVIQNVNFELVVLHNEFGWFLSDVDDTRLMSSYVDENFSTGLKQNSARWLGYEQTSYEQTVTFADRETGEVRKHKMDELTLDQMLAYGADDTICTAALYNWYKIHMTYEGVWDAYREVEIGAAYWVAQAFIDGISIDNVALSKMIKRDEADKSKQFEVLNEYLIEQSWAGSVLLKADNDNYQTPAWIKYAFEIMNGKPLVTAVRKFERVIEAVRDHGDDLFADLLEAGQLGQINLLLESKFDGTPAFNTGSPKQMQKLLYETMGLPIRLRNKPTDNMRAAGVLGTPKTDSLAFATALHYDLSKEDKIVPVLRALQQIKMLETRDKMFYANYPTLPHWKTNKIHGSINQCATVTRRFTSSKPK